MKESDILKELIGENNEVHLSDLREKGLKPSYDLPGEPRYTYNLLCVYCNHPWNPEMIETQEAMGYCESCYDTSSVNFIACSNCGKIVYSK